MSKELINLGGLSLGLNEREVIKIGDITLVYYKNDFGSDRVKILAPKELNISREDRKKFFEEKGLTKN